MNSEELKKRTKKFALDVIKLIKSFPKEKATDVIDLFNESKELTAIFAATSKISEIINLKS